MRLSEVLRSFSDRKIYYKPNPGNGGDALIAAGAFEYFDKFNIEYEILKENHKFDPKGKTIFYPGGGNLVEEYHNAADFLRKNHKKAEKIILMPHTINGHSELLESFGDNIILFAREEKSYTFLKELDLNCKVMIDHDLALLLHPSQFINESTNLHKRLYRQIILKKIIRLNTNFDELNVFRVDVEKSSIDIPNDNIDISNVIISKWEMDDQFLIKRTVADMFCLLNNFKTVNTNRLHVAIAAALLSKNVNLYPNSYWKNEAIFNYSLKNKFPNVKFIEI